MQTEEEAFEEEQRAVEQKLEETFGPVRAYFDKLAEEHPEEHDFEGEFLNLLNDHIQHKNGGNYFLVRSRMRHGYGDLQRTIEFVEFARRSCAEQGIDICFGTELRPEMTLHSELERHIAIGIRPEEDYRAKVPALLETYFSLIKRIESGFSR